MQNESTVHGPYFTSIDGMRAIAVLFVLLFHLDVSFFAGGYIGVDVFFVISGFLITKNILADIERRQFSFAEFYMRRVARLLPALFATLGLTLVAAFFVLGPDDLARLGRVALLSVISLSNVFFFFESSYFDPAGAFKPLLHTWSLGVEEQFYLFWPLLLLFASKTPRRALSIILLVGAASLLAAAILASTRQSAVFFLTPFRIYQFAGGAALAIVGLGARTCYTSAASIASVAVLFVLAGTRFDAETNYFWTNVAPTLAAVAMIWSSQSAFALRLLASAPARWLGQRSYSIYLVHWPLIVLWKVSTDFSLSEIERLFVFTLSIVAGAMLFRGVEKRFRFRTGQCLWSRVCVLAGVTASGAVLLVWGSHLWALHGFPDRVPADLRDAALGVQVEWDKRQKELRSGTCNFMIHTFDAAEYDVNRCSRPPVGKKSYLVIGDSFAADAYLVMARAFPEVYFGQVTVPGCQLRMPKRFAEPSPCRELFELAINELATKQGYDGVVLASNWIDGHYYRIDELISHFERAGLEILLVGQHIRFADRLPSIVSTALNREAAVEKAKRLILDTQYKVNTIIESRFSGRVKFVDFMKLQCEPECTVFAVDGKLAYLDDSHLSAGGAEVVARRMRTTYPEIAKNMVRPATRSAVYAP